MKIMVSDVHVVCNYMVLFLCPYQCWIYSEPSASSAAAPNHTVPSEGHGSTAGWKKGCTIQRMEERMFSIIWMEKGFSTQRIEERMLNTMDGGKNAQHYGWRKECSTLWMEERMHNGREDDHWPQRREGRMHTT
jgi:hypothetical protein